MIATHRRHNRAGVGDWHEDQFVLELGVREACTEIFEQFFELKL